MGRIINQNECGDSLGLGKVEIFDASEGIECRTARHSGLQMFMENLDGSNFACRDFLIGTKNKIEGFRRGVNWSIWKLPFPGHKRSTERNLFDSGYRLAKISNLGQHEPLSAQQVMNEALFNDYPSAFTVKKLGHHPEIRRRAFTATM